MIEVSNNRRVSKDNEARFANRIHQYVQTFLVPLLIAMFIGAIGFWYRTGVDIVGLRKSDSEHGIKIQQLQAKIVEHKELEDKVDKLYNEIFKQLASCQKSQAKLEETVKWACGTPDSLNYQRQFFKKEPEGG